MIKTQTKQNEHFFYSFFFARWPFDMVIERIITFSWVIKLRIIECFPPVDAIIENILQYNYYCLKRVKPSVCDFCMSQPDLRRWPGFRIQLSNPYKWPFWGPQCCCSQISCWEGKVAEGRGQLWGGGSCLRAAGRLFKANSVHCWVAED